MYVDPVVIYHDCYVGYYSWNKIYSNENQKSSVMVRHSKLELMCCNNIF